MNSFRRWKNKISHDGEEGYDCIKKIQNTKQKNKQTGKQKKLKKTLCNIFTIQCHLVFNMSISFRRKIPQSFHS